MMSKMKNLLAGALMAFAILLLPQTIQAAETISVTTVNDITDVKDVTSTDYQVGTGEYSNLVKFTLSKPAYVYVSAYSTVCSEGFSIGGNMSQFAVYSDANCSNLVTGDTVEDVNAYERVSKYLCLDAGNYWIQFKKDDKDLDKYIENGYGEFRLSVAAEYLSVTGSQNGSWKRAKKISTDKDITGFLSSNTRTSWFKFTVGSNTTAQLRLCLENPLGEAIHPSSEVGVTVYRSNKSIIERLDISDAYYDAVYSNTLSLTKGTYYIGITGDSNYGRWDETKLVKNDTNSMGVVSFRITTVKKGTVSKVANVKGKKAKVTFKAVSGAKGYEVQYSTNKNFKNAKVKTAGAKATNVTIKSLTKNKNYYFRVRAFKYDADGNKVYGDWSNSKSVKIKK